MPFYGIIAVDILPLAFKLFAYNYDFFMFVLYICIYFSEKQLFHNT